MTLQDLIEKTKRHPIPSVCGLITLLCLLVFYFRMDLVSYLESTLEDVSGREAVVDANLVAGLSLGEDLAAMKTLVSEIETRVVRASELEVNLRYFYKIESDTGVAIADLRQNAAAAPAKGAPKTVFVAIPYSVILSGKFGQAIAYLNELETGPRFYRLRGFNLQHGRDVDSTSVTLSLNLELLGWP